MWSTALAAFLFLSSAMANPAGRIARSPNANAGATSGSSSFSSSSSSSSSSSGGGGGGAGVGGLHNAGQFHFPTPGPYFSFPSAGFQPNYDFNQVFQQFLNAAQAAHSYAAQNPGYNQFFQQQLALLALLQQMALAQYPFAFPGFESNSIAPEGGSQFGGSSSSSSSQSGLVGGGYGSTGGFGGQPGFTGQSSFGAQPGFTGQSGYGGQPGFASAAPAGAGSGSNFVHTSGGVTLGPQGGYGVASAAPGGPDGLGVRISEELPAPSGGSFGTFSSSSSGVSNVNGKKTSFKTSTFGVNDNGKITFKTVSE